MSAPHWKHRATRCAVEGCERTRMKGWTTCSLIGHAEQRVSLYGLKPGEPRLKPSKGAIQMSQADTIQRVNQRAVDAFADFIAAVAAPTGRLRLTENAEGEVLYAAVEEARATLNHLRGQVFDLSTGERL